MHVVTPGRRSYTRTEAIDLVRHAPPPPSTAVTKVTLISCAAVSGFLVSLLGLLQHVVSATLLMTLGAGAAAPVAWFLREHDCKFLALLCWELWSSRSGMETSCELSSRGTTRNADEISAGKWVCRVDLFPRSASYANYELVIATINRSGRQMIGFANGRSEVWGWNKRFYVQSRTTRDSPAMRTGQLDGAVAELLDSITGLLHEHSPANPRLSAWEVVANLPANADPEDLLLALGVARRWGLVATHRLATENLRSLVRACRGLTLITEDVVGARLIQLTTAGEYWCDAGKAAQEERESAKRRREMTRQDRPFSQHVVINGNSGVVNVGKNVTGKSSSRTKLEPAPTPSDRQILAFLRAVLSRDDIPWDDPSLEGVRRTVVDAVTDEDPRRPELRPAIKLLLAFCSDVMVGVLSDWTSQGVAQLFT